MLREPSVYGGIVRMLGFQMGLKIYILRNFLVLDYRPLMGIRYTLGQHPYQQQKLQQQLLWIKLKKLKKNSTQINKMR